MKTELLKAGIIYEIGKQIDEMEIDETKIADTEAINMLLEIRGIITNEKTNAIQKINEIEGLFECRKLDFAKNKKLNIYKNGM